MNLQPGRTYSLQEFQAAQRSAGVTPSSVASGFVLYNPGYRRDNYNYDSNWANIGQAYCTSSCVVQDEWQVQFHEWVQGTNSKLWRLTMNARKVTGSDSAAFDYWYACAINVSGNPDHYCINGADPSNDTGAFNPGDYLWKYFENNNYSNTEYPMIKLGAQFPHVYDSFRFRGFDVCTSANSTKLCASSGTGN
jgi:hypothetical protein